MQLKIIPLLEQKSISQVNFKEFGCRPRTEKSAEREGLTNADPVKFGGQMTELGCFFWRISRKLRERPNVR